MSDPINRNYPNNEAVYQRRTGISRSTDTPAENSLINPFYNLLLHQARPTGQAILSSKPDKDKFSPGLSSTCPQYLPASDNDGAAFPAQVLVRSAPVNLLWDGNAWANHRAEKRDIQNIDDRR